MFMVVAAKGNADRLVSQVIEIDREFLWRNEFLRAG